MACIRVSVIVSRCLLICGYFVFPVALKGKIVSFLVCKYQIIWYYILPVTKVLLAALPGFHFRGMFHCKRALCCQMTLVTVQRFLLCSLHYGGDSETSLWNLSFWQQIYSETLLQVLFLIVLFDLCLCICVQGVVEVFHFAPQQQWHGHLSIR